MNFINWIDCYGFWMEISGKQEMKGLKLRHFSIDYFESFGTGACVCVCFLILLLPFETRRLKNFKNFKNCKVVCTEKKLIHLKMRWKWFIVEMNLRKNETNVKNAAFAHPIIYRLINKKCKRKVSRITNFKVVIFGNASRLNGYL